MSIGTQDGKLRLGLTSSASRRDAQRERELHELRVELRATPIAGRRPATFRRRGLWTIEDEKDIHACGLTLDKPEHERLEREIGPAKAISSACDHSKVKKRTSHPGADQRSSRGPAVGAGVSWIVRRASALRTHHNEERRVYSEPKAPLVLHEERVAEIIERVDLALRLDRVPEAGDGLRASVNPCWLQDICESVPS